MALTDQQITDIAREYGKEKANEYSYAIYRDPDTKRQIKACSIANQAAPIIRWLSKRFCLVEKSKLIEEYRKCMLIQMDDSPNLSAEYVGNAAAKMELIELLFPEIAKEVE